MVEDTRSASRSSRTSQHAPGGRSRHARDRDAVGVGSVEALLPSLEPGLTLLSVESRAVPVIGSLVLDHLLSAAGPALWVDAQGHAATTTLARLAPSRRLLERIRVARGFTAPQHHAILRDLPDATPSLVVAPAVDARYRDADAVRAQTARRLQARGLARLAAYTRADVPVLVTRTDDDAFGAAVARAADHRLTCESTRMGPRFVGDAFESVAYPVGDGAYRQTTFAYWRRVLDARADAAGLEPSADPAGSDDGPTAATDGGASAPPTDPLLAAWSDAAGPGGRH